MGLIPGRESRMRINRRSSTADFGCFETKNTVRACFLRAQKRKGCSGAISTAGTSFILLTFALVLGERKLPSL